jgi:Tfp pilus assembly protein PilF
MNVRMLARVLAGLLVLSPTVGCQNLTTFKPPSLGLHSMAAPTAEGENSQRSQKTLPNKESAELSFTLAEGMAASGHEADAIIHYERCRQFDPKRTGIAARLAVLYGRVGQSKEALAEFEKAIKESPDDPAIHNNMGYFHYSAGNWVEAEQCCRKALTLDSQHRHAWVNLGLILGMQNRYAESYEAFTKILNPDEAHANLGFVYLTQGQKEMAKTECRKALQMNPSNPKAQGMLSILDGKMEKSKIAAAPPIPRSKDMDLVPPLPPHTTP